MSQPYDGHRSFLPFGNPFRMLFPKESYLSPKYAALLSSFEQTLAESLKKLKPEDIWSLSWLRHAINCLAETHINIKSLITDLELPVCDWEAKWIDIYLDNSLKLLDICIALSAELSRLDHCQVLVKYVLHAIDLSSKYPSAEQLKRAQITLSNWMNHIDVRSPKLEDCCVILHGLAGTLYSSKVKTSTKGKVLMRALYGVKVVTIFLFSVFTSALCGCTTPSITLVVPGKYLWAETFNDLQAEVLKGKVMVLKEVDAVQKCVKTLCALSDPVGQKEKEILNNVCHNEVVMLESNNDHAEEENWKESVLELVQEVERLSLGLDNLSKQVGDFFQIVLMGRDALLCNFRVLDEVTMQESDNEIIGHSLHLSRSKPNVTCWLQSPQGDCKTELHNQ